MCLPFPLNVVENWLVSIVNAANQPVQPPIPIWLLVADVAVAMVFGAIWGWLVFSPTSFRNQNGDEPEQEQAEFVSEETLSHP